MKERILFIFLLFSVSAFSQEKASMGTIKLTAIVPDSLLNMKVLHYAQELKYVDKDAQQDTYDAASFFIINWGRKINCVMRRFFPSSSVGDRPAPRGCTSTPRRA